MYKDKTITCRDCGKEFDFTASEQKFYAEKGFTNEPGRCPECRAARKRQSRNGNSRGRSGGQRQMYPAVCSDCGKETQVPFKPSGEKPVYCNDCFQPRKRNQW